MKALFVFSMCLSLTGCAQKQKPESITKQQYPKTHMMNLSIITNVEVRKAIEALQSGDQNWYLYFTDNPEMTDDGHKVDFKSFFKKALGNEKFLSIDRVEDDGKTLYGNFKAGQWGTFRVFFKFHQNTAGKFERLDIGQAN
ncbi:hypothetical protein M2T78_16805 [Elizabethkingia ursingii]|uniref:hypothetical protein n=1 Tax=Elizabethkingia ursingii TaxID=1756150 RepID=UPI0020134657|nr:hypothetical protein [Elizabethkingia ursingii]MCL1665927.1 hypothetical protein [Elizabethkingia ursingii]